MKRIAIAKASPIGDWTVEPVTITIDGEPPRFDYGASDCLEQAGHFYAAEAKRLADALANSLPGGTLDRLLIRLMEHKASLHRVPSWMQDTE